MPSQINASNSGFGGIVSTGDSSGVLELQTTGTTAVTIDTSQRVGFVAGTAAAPAITRTGDTNTGMFFPAADTIAFAEGGVEAMRLDASGNVGIGTSSFALSAAGRGDLEIAGSSTAVVGLKGGSNQAYVFNDGTNVYVANASASGNIVFQPATNTERMRIDSNGNLLINKTALPSAISTATNLLYIENATGDGQIILNNTRGLGSQFMEQFWRQGTLVGSIQATLSATTYVTSSDYRLKDNIAPMTGALDKLAQLKPVTYKWKQDGSDGQGFIAHELQEHFPDAVVGEKDDVDEKGNIKPQGIDTSFLVATLTAAIQEQQAIINDLKARIETLEAK